MTKRKQEKAPTDRIAAALEGIGDELERISAALELLARCTHKPSGGYGYEKDERYFSILNIGD